MVHKHLKISGRVQGVGFRHFTRQNARDLEINGWVKNMRDGTVETVLSGSPKDVETMIKRLQKGPISARVDDIKELESDAVNEDYNRFSVRR